MCERPIRIAKQLSKNFMKDCYYDVVNSSCSGSEQLDELNKTIIRKIIENLT